MDGNKDKERGKLDKAKGEVKDQYGKLTNDKSKQAEGKYDKAKGNVEDKVGEAKNETGDKHNN